jgi:hypothetical protein
MLPRPPELNGERSRVSYLAFRNSTNPFIKDKSKWEKKAEEDKKRYERELTGKS